MSQTESATATRVSHCADEPIHIPGSIQPHGFLLGVEEPELVIRQLSENCESLLSIDTSAALGQPIEQFLTAESLRDLQEKLQSSDLHQVNPITMQFVGVANTWNAVVQRTQGLLMLEIEPSVSGDPSFLDVYRKINAAGEAIGAAADLAELYQVTVRWVKDLTGYQRVMIYEFDAEWNGRVVAETREAHQEPFLGLHYPASDIPAQARRLYTTNWLRTIPDVHYSPSPIFPGRHHLSGAPLDLSGCSFRSVSPIHIHYLKNMGVGASTSISVIKDGVLWGLIALHHERPVYLPFEVRKGLEFIGRIFSLQQAAREKLENRDYQHHLKNLQRHLENKMKQQADFIDGLLRESPDFTALVQGGCGGAILHRGKLALIGDTPPEQETRELTRWLGDFLESRSMFYTASLVKDYPPAENFKERGAGLLVISIPEVEPFYVLWFKPEVVQTVDWGGDPRKTAGPAALTPRHSFALWQETVRLTALPWPPEEIEAAEALRRSIIEVDLENQVRIAMDSNAELDQFASVISHDLKEPLRGIRFFADFLLEDTEGRLDSESLTHLQEIKKLAGKTSDLIGDLYEYSKIGRIEMAFDLVDMNEILQGVEERLKSLLREHNAQLSIVDILPTVFCDRVRVCEIFANLITNAVKYNDSATKFVKVGANFAGDVPVFFVRDNGIGILPQNRERVFAMFQRLHTDEAYGGGTGVGLAIVKRIVDRHGGRIWVESQPGEGSSFHFTLRPPVQL
jgi:light-regulated signal transduction histidine kinase (bacteriophytochrome)